MGGRSCLLLTGLVACSGSSTAPPVKWDLVAQNQPSALLSTWATGDTDAWVVGGYDGSGSSGPVVAHYNGTAWTQIATGLPATIDLWWVKGFDDGTVLVSGSQDTIAMTTDGTTFTPMTTPTGNATVFGVWGAATDDIWAVGGTGQGGAFVWHYTGTTWAPQTIDSDIVTCWKVNGLTSTNVWISCTNGVTLNWNGTALVRHNIAEAVQQQASLFSIGVSSERVVTVGGASTGLLFESDDGGTTWQSPLSSVGVLLSGVAVSETDAYAVGGGGTILHRNSNATWAAETSGTFEDLHSTFIDPSGAVWAVGGAFDQTPTTMGVLLHAGSSLTGSFP
jgi:hypothetical protein